MYPDPHSLMDSTAAARVNAYLGGHGTLAQLEREVGGFGLSAPNRQAAGMTMRPLDFPLRCPGPAEPARSGLRSTPLPVRPAQEWGWQARPATSHTERRVVRAVVRRGELPVRPR